MALGGLVLFVLVSALLMVRLFVSPPSAHPTAADAVVAVNADQQGVTAALQLMQRQVAPVLVLPGGAAQAGDLAHQLCSQTQAFEVVCPAVSGDRVRTDAKTVGKLATQRGWHKVAVVAEPAQLSRARLLLGRCTQAKLLPVASTGSASHRFRKVRDEIGPYLRALIFERDC